MATPSRILSNDHDIFVKRIRLHTFITMLNFSQFELPFEMTSCCLKIKSLLFQVIKGIIQTGTSRVHLSVLVHLPSAYKF